MRFRLLTLGAAILASVLFAGCPQSECDKAKAAKDTACQLDPNGQACTSATVIVAALCTTTPPPPPPPLVCGPGTHKEQVGTNPPQYVCVADPPPPPDKCPAGTHAEAGKCVPDLPPPPPAATCPATCPADAQTVNNRCLNFNPQTGKCVTDATGRCGDRGDDQGYCGKVTNNPAIHSCKVNPEGAGFDACDWQFWGFKCASWYYSMDNGASWNRCLPDGIDGVPNQPFSCDHFDNYTDTAGAYTGTCERGPSGGPITGYAMVPHGKGKVHACKKDLSKCGPDLDIDY